MAGLVQVGMHSPGEAARVMTLRLTSLYGTGDTYLVCSLLRAAERHHGRPAELTIKSSHAGIPEMFGIEYWIDNEAVEYGEQAGFQLEYDNDLLHNWQRFYVHPRFVKSRVRVDMLTAKDQVSMADMYRALLQLPMSAPQERPTPPFRVVGPSRAILIPRSRSWPTDVARLWPALASSLRDAGWQVVENDESWSLAQLLDRCADAEWVIGPQCGVMSILCHAQFPCRKTIITPSIDGMKYHEFPPAHTYPYAYVTKFAGEDYDVEEHVVSDELVEGIIGEIVHGPNAQRMWPHDPRPVTTFMAPLTTGELLDRLAILTVKAERLPRAMKGAMWREFQRYADVWGRSPLYDQFNSDLMELIALHSENFDILEQMVPDALQKGVIETQHHIAAMKSNKDRVAIKARINSAARSPYPEVKSYYR